MSAVEQISDKRQGLIQAHKHLKRPGLLACFLMVTQSPLHSMLPWRPVKGIRVGTCRYIVGGSHPRCVHSGAGQP